MVNYTLEIGGVAYNLKDVIARGSWGIQPQLMIASFWGPLIGQSLDGIQFASAVLKRDGVTLANYVVRSAYYIREPVLQTFIYGIDNRTLLSKPFESIYGDIRFYINENLTTLAAAIAGSCGMPVTAESYPGISVEIVFATCADVLLQAALASQKEAGYRHEAGCTMEIKNTVGTTRAVTFSNSNCIATQIGVSSTELINELWSVKDTGFSPLGGWAKDAASQGVYGKWRIIKVTNQLLVSHHHVNFASKIVPDLCYPIPTIWARAKSAMGCYPDDTVSVSFDEASGSYRVTGVEYNWSETADEVIIYELKKLSYILSNLFLTPIPTRLSILAEKATYPTPTEGMLEPLEAQMPARLREWRY